jgi:hypothetical protein
MFSLNETKPQSWRAVAVFDDRPDMLIFLHRSSTQIRAGYRTAFLDLLDEEEREHVTSISMQKWQGAADAGRWIPQSTLPLPTPANAEKLAA